MDYLPRMFTQLVKTFVKCCYAGDQKRVILDIAELDHDYIHASFVDVSRPVLNTVHLFQIKVLAVLLACGLYQFHCEIFCRTNGYISGNFQGIYISRISLVQAQFVKYKIPCKYYKDMVPSSRS